MMTSNKLTPELLRRAAIVYVRQSKPSQVIHHQESNRLQYALVDRARSLGFQQVTVIDDDLGRTGSGLVERPGFERLVVEVCSGQVGAVFCIEASRLARNGRDWHHLIELCGLTGILVIDPDGMYDPRLPNDRLLLGLKGTMSEFELHLFRQRSAEAILQKARRGELQFRLPTGLCWTPQGKIEIEADLRVQQAIRLVQEKFTKLGSARQVLLAFRRERVLLPVKHDDRWGSPVEWKPASYHGIVGILKNPMYAGAYAFGKTEVHTNIIEGRARKTEGHDKPRERWTVLIRDHHPAYISWEQFERNQLVLRENAYMKSRMGRKSGRGGRSLLTGLLRCRRCGRMLNLRYSGPGGNLPCFRCRSTLNHAVTQCVHFVGWRPDQAVAQEILRAIEGSAVEAAIEAAERISQQDAEWQQALKLELEQARYEAQLAERRYEAVDPAQRLVAGELEARWNRALEKVQEVEKRLQTGIGTSCSQSRPDKEALLALAEDLPAIWNAPETDMRLKQRIARILIEEIVADVEEKTNEIVLIVHWAGGRHSELRVAKNKIGHHGHANKVEVLDVVRQMASQYADEQIATTLNRLGLRTGWNNTWNKQRVRDVRSKLHLPVFDEAQVDRTILTMEQAAKRLHTSSAMIKRLIEAKVLAATQVVPCAPWQISEEAIKSQVVMDAVKTIAGGRSRNVPQSENSNTNQLTFSMS
jgi:DNA invertase Pin-like site-specific DNA recombinase